MAKAFKQLKNTFTCVVCGEDVEESYHKYCTIHMDLAPRIPFYKREEPDFTNEVWEPFPDWEF